MKRGNIKKVYQGLPLIYKDQQTNPTGIPYAYWSHAHGKYITIYGKYATKHDMDRFAARFKKYYYKQEIDLWDAIFQARDDVGEGNGEVKPEHKLAHKLAEKKKARAKLNKEKLNKGA
jgi:hypothetical protein